MQIINSFFPLLFGGVAMTAAIFLGAKADHYRQLYREQLGRNIELVKELKKCK